MEGGGRREEGELIKGFQSEKSKGTIERADVTAEAEGGASMALGRAG